MHRAFEQRPVDEETVAKLLWAVGRAPTARAGVRQFLVASDPKLVALVRQVCPGFINDAPTIVLVFTDLDRAETLVGARGCELIARVDAGAAAAYLSLAAPALGLGLCITTSWTEAAVQEIFGLPDRCRPEVLIGVGYPSAKPSPTTKASPPVVFESTYGRTWGRGG
jgi:nitroreductase